MTTEHVILIAIAIVGLMQAGMIFILTRVLNKFEFVCTNVSNIHEKLGLKMDRITHERSEEKLEAEVGRIGDRVLKLELNITPKIIEK